VLTQQEKSQAFLEDLDIQIERLTSPYLNKKLRQWMNRAEDFDQGHVPFDKWLNDLTRAAKRLLDLDLSNPYFQADWPMLLRVMTLQRYEAELDRSAVKKERKQFLKAIRRIPSEVFEAIQDHLESPVLSHRLADPETSRLFERMAASLPHNFPYHKSPNINRLIRRTWCSTKDPQMLKHHLDIFITYHNQEILKNLSLQLSS